jgi:electron transfer flavoprotein alpha subunit
LIPATSVGEELAARVAVRIKTGVVTECTLLEMTKEGLLAMTRPSYGGKVNITMICPSARPQMATVQPGAMRIDEPDQSRKVEVVKVSVKVKPRELRSRIVGFMKGDPRTMDLSEAEIIVAGGQGVGSVDKFSVIEELADLLGACVGGTRSVVDAGWIPFERQIGQTGKTVAPRCYIACGISGAIQHVMGMKESKTIIAINIDRNAPIFKLADIGIVEDLHKVIPALIKELQELVETTGSTQEVV